MATWQVKYVTGWYYPEGRHAKAHTRTIEVNADSRVMAQIEMAHRGISPQDIVKLSAIAEEET